jgi:hypothetical protein
MPILILGLIALAMFLVMGFLLFSAMMAERRSRMRRAAAGASVEAKADDETYKSRAASA